MSIEEAIKLIEEDKQSYIEASECGLGYPSDNREHKEKAQAIEIVLQHLKFYKEGLEREIDSNRENVIKIIQQDRELEKKNKTMNEMADFISKYHCFEISVFDIDNECKAEHNCKECIKQYFEKKV